MTFKEKLAKEHPNCIDAKCGGGALGCPCNSEYGYEKEFWCGDGIETSEKCTECWNREILTEKTYEEGLQDAWELAKKFISYDRRHNDEIWGYETAMDIIHHLTPQEALAQLKTYEETKEIKVGDIVYNDDTMEEGVVTYIDDGEVFMLYDDGSYGNANGVLTKTGRHIDIESLLGQIRGTENELR